MSVPTKVAHGESQKGSGRCKEPSGWPVGVFEDGPLSGRSRAGVLNIRAIRPVSSTHYSGAEKHFQRARVTPLLQRDTWARWHLCTCTHSCLQTGSARQGLPQCEWASSCVCPLLCALSSRAHRLLPLPGPRALPLHFQVSGQISPPQRGSSDSNGVGPLRCPVSFLAFVCRLPTSVCRLPVHILVCLPTLLCTAPRTVSWSALYPCS